MFNFNHLYYFYVAAHFGGVSKASKIVKVSQPSLTKQIKVLEGTLNRALFRKVGRNMELTAEGESVYQYCRRMFSTAEELERSLRDSSLTETTQLRIGVTEQIAKPFIADILTELVRDRGKRLPQMKIVSGNKEQLLDALRAHELDLALTNGVAYGSEFMEVGIFDMPVGLVVSRSLYLQHRKALLDGPRFKTWMAASGLGLVLPSEKLKLRHETDHYLQKYDVRSEVILESDVVSLVVRAVVDGVGVGLLPLAYLANELAVGSVIQLFRSRSFWQHQLRMVVRKRETLDPQIKAMVVAMTSIKERTLSVSELPSGP